MDASAALLGLVNDGEARAMLGAEAIVSPHLIDTEIVHAIRSQVLRGHLEVGVAEQLIDVWQRLGIERVGVSGLLGRMWELRENVSAYDASYVAAAEALEVPLVTADGRLARAPGPRCTVTVLRR